LPREIPTFTNKLLAVELLYLFALYYVFLLAIIVSDILFVLGVLGMTNIVLQGPYTTVWIVGIFLFVFEILLALSYDREDTSMNVLLTCLMYFTYCQLWIYVVGKAIYLDTIKKERQTWEKTVRFEVGTSSAEKRRE
jgi:hypothetical protein